MNLYGFAENDGVARIDILGNNPIANIYPTLTNSRLICCCINTLRYQMEFSISARKAYEECGKNNPSSYDQLMTCVKGKLSAQYGGEVSAAGTATADNEVTINKNIADPCDSLTQEITVIHEAVHIRQNINLKMQFPMIKDYLKAFADPQQAVKDELEAHLVDIGFTKNIILFLENECSLNSATGVLPHSIINGDSDSPKLDIPLPLPTIKPKPYLQ